MTDDFPPDDDRPRRWPRGGATPAKKKPKTLVIVLIVVGVLSLCACVPLALLIPGLSMLRDSAAREKGANNMKQIGLGQHMVQDVTGGMVGPYAVGADRAQTVNKELSFRVSLLPYIEQGAVYQQFDLTQAWDSPRNAAGAAAHVAAYDYPHTSDRTKSVTPYRVFYGGGAIFEADGKPVSLASVADGVSNTILFVHATEEVRWAKPQEFAYSRTTALPPLGLPRQGGFNAAFADGSVRYIRGAIPEADLRSLIEKADGRGAGIE